MHLEDFAQVCLIKISLIHALEKTDHHATPNTKASNCKNELSEALAMQ